MEHKLLHCKAMRADLFWQVLVGILSWDDSLLSDPGLAPLCFRCFPPRLLRHGLVDFGVCEGGVRQGIQGIFFGDGSGVRDGDGSCIATWALVT